MSGGSAGWWWETDAQHRLLQLFGRPTHIDPGGATVLGLRPWEISGLEADAPASRAIRASLQSCQPFHDLAWSRRDSAGRLHHCVISGQPLFSPRGRFRGYRGVGRDVTEQVEAERALNASESQLAAIIDSAMDAILTVDAQQRIVMFNSAAAALFGCNRFDALGEPLARFVPGGLAGIIAACGTRGPDPWTQLRPGQVAALRGDGQGVPVEASMSRVELRGQELVTVVLRDLTDRLAWDRARAALEAQLRESQKMEALGTLAGGIAHDFNNIVAAILGNAALAASQLPAGNRARAFLDEIGKAGLRARDLVERIMAFSRRQPAVFSCQPLQPLVEEAVQLLRATLPSGVEIRCTLEAEPLHLMADATQITQVLMNLGTNAWQALGGEPGGVDFTLARHGEAELCLQVTDTGCGMDEATQARIFEPFFTTKAKGEGTGLGLPVVHGVVTGHGGCITVKSQRGQGTSFRIVLPLATSDRVNAAPPPARAASPGALPGPGRGHGEHVVYLDDYPAIGLMVKAALEARGYRVTSFETVDAAMDYMRDAAHAVHVFVSDYNMPGRCGLAVARELRALRPELPVVVASGYVTDELRDGAAQAGVARLFDKPRGIDGLGDLIDELLRSHESSSGCASPE